MKTVVVGAGSLGMLFAYKLAAAGLKPTLITRTYEQKNKIGREGLRLEQPSMNAVYLSCLAFEEWKEADLKQWDWVLCTVKQPYVHHLLSSLRSMNGNVHTNWLFLQNGIGHVEVAVDFICSQQLFCGVTTEAARKTDGRTVKHTGKGHTWIGKPYMQPLEKQAPFDSSVQKLCKQLSLAGIQASVSKNIHSKIWEKLVVNAVINPVTGITGVTNGKLLESQDLLALMQLLYQECVTVAEAEQVELSPHLWQHLLNVCRHTSNNRSSMLQDLDQGRVTEVDWINGSIITRAEHHGISVPVNKTVYHLIKARHDKLDV